MSQKNSNMAAKHAKAKKEALKAVAENNYALMSSGLQTTDKSDWHRAHKTEGYLTPRGNIVLRAQIVEKYHEIDSQITEYVRSGERIPRELRRQYQSIMNRVNLYGLQTEIRAAV